MPHSSRTCSGCSGNGHCYDGKCFCRPGYRGANCTELDFCVRGCSGDGHGVCLGEQGCDCLDGFFGDLDEACEALLGDPPEVPVRDALLLEEARDVLPGGRALAEVAEDGAHREAALRRGGE